MTDPVRVCTVALHRPLDLARTCFPMRHGHGDPTIHIDGTEVVRATRTPAGPATVQLRVQGDRLQATAHGAGGEYALDAVRDLVGEHDDIRDFEPLHACVAELHRRLRGVRITRTRAVFEALVPSILEQKVIGAEARRSYQQLVRSCAEPAPGPFGLLLPPAPEEMAAMPYFTFHALGVERKRADTVRRAALVARRLEEAATMSRDDATRRLTAVRGVGPWTAAEVGLVALGDADAVPVGDFHLANTVAWNLAGHARADDAEMLELLEPYRGHRGRVIRYLKLSGNSAPAFGPRLGLRDLRSH